MTKQLTLSDAMIIIDAAQEADVPVRDFPLWGDTYTIAVEANEFAFQRMLRHLGELTAHDDQQQLIHKLGKWTFQGVAMSTVWYWDVPLTEEAHDHVRAVEDEQEEYR